jgi:hypothetical protein
MIDLSGAIWRKSSRSGANGNCVEVATNLTASTGLVAVRDSKDPGGPALTFPVAEWERFIHGIKDGQV